MARSVRVWQPVTYDHLVEAPLGEPPLAQRFARGQLLSPRWGAAGSGAGPKSGR